MEDDEKKKGKQVAGVSTYIEINSLTRRLEEEDIAINEYGWYVNSGALKHMTGSQELFETLAEWDSKLHMVLGDKSHKEIQGLEVVPFRMETGWVMRVQDVLFVLGLRCSMMSISMAEKKEFEVLF